jgi:Tfp pilus assembly protein PilO
MSEPAKQKLSPSQEKLLIVGGVILAALFIAWFFIYHPSKKMVRFLRDELAKVEGQIKQTDEMLSQGKALEEKILLFEDIEKVIETRVPRQEEEGINLLSDYAHKRDLGIAAIRSESKAPLLDQAGQPFVIGGRHCHRLSVFMEMSGRYENLVGYILDLKEFIPSFVTIEAIQIRQGGDAAKSELMFSISVNLYLLD